MENMTSDADVCLASINAVKDALYVINGKWKMLVIVALTEGPRRFKEIERSLEGITPKVLTKELRELELNEFVSRKVHNGSAMQVTYELTPYAATLKEIISSLRDWGEQHKKYILDKRRLEHARGTL